MERAACGPPFLFSFSAQMACVNISPSLAAIGGASIVAVIVAFVLRPAQLAPHSAETSAQHESVHAAPAERPRLLVYVAGAVAHPGVYALAGDARAGDALAKAGGATHDADLVAVNLAAHVADGDEVAVPHQGDERAAPTTRSGPRRTASPVARRTRRSPRRSTARTDAPAGDATQTVDLNTADVSALSELPGIGPTLAERIVEFRTLNGPFASVDGLADVAGITPQRLDALAPLVTAGR
jgi:DNA uptake protein ComE-like DNA-binding protein